MNRSKKAGTLLLGAALLLVVAVLLTILDTVRIAAAGLALFMLGLFLVFLAAGAARTDRYAGILIDARNRVSLSRLNTILWTCLIGGTYAAYALLRIGTGTPNPTNIDIDRNLVELMGLTAAGLGTSAVIQRYKSASNRQLTPDERDADQMSTLRWNASKLVVQYNKSSVGKNNPVTHEDLASVLDPLASDDPDVRPRVFADVEALAAKGAPKQFMTWYRYTYARSPPLGTLVRNPEPSFARAADLVQAEEVGSAHRTDLGKLQLLVLNLILMLLFVVAAVKPLLEPTSSVCDGTGPDTACLALPTLTGGLVGILAASQGGYLLNKGAGNPLDRWSEENKTELDRLPRSVGGAPPAEAQVRNLADEALQKAASQVEEPLPDEVFDEGAGTGKVPKAGKTPEPSGS